MTFLETSRLLLRKFEEDDFEDFCKYAMDDQMSRMMGRNLLHTKEAARSSFDWLKNKADRSYVLVYKNTGRVIGNLNVSNIRDELTSLKSIFGKEGRTLSFCISKNYQRKGLMREAVSAVIDHLFQNENMDFVQCGCFSFNKASEALQKKLGFQYLTTTQYEEHDRILTTYEHVLWREQIGM